MTVRYPRPEAPTRTRVERRALRTWGTVPDYVVIPAILCALCIGLTALIYWGGFVEEGRNGR